MCAMCLLTVACALRPCVIIEIIYVSLIKCSDLQVGTRFESMAINSHYSS